MLHLDRRQTLLGMGAALMASPATSLAAAPFEWPPIAPAEAGFAPDLEARLDKPIADKRVWNLHGVVIVRNDRLVLERYFAGRGSTRAASATSATSRSSPTRCTTCARARKASSLCSTASRWQQGKVPPPEAPLFAAFPEYADLASEDGRDRLTIHHVLTMTMGTDWDESSLPYSDPRNSEIAMDIAPDRYRYVLERRVVDDARRALDLLRRRDRSARAHHRQGHGQNAARIRARKPVRSARAWARPNG